MSSVEPDCPEHGLRLGSYYKATISVAKAMANYPRTMNEVLEFVTSKRKTIKINKRDAELAAAD